MVDVGYGKYQGFLDNGARKWQGIRFAAAPTGANRFKAPQDPVAFEGIQNATEFGAICPPQQATDYTLSGSSTQFYVDEDCLFLSVVAPDTSSTDLKPVHVFIQGGGFSSNSNSNYDASEVVNDADIVSVQFNYRVGMLGFLFSNESVADGSSPNAGVEDMIKVLEWIQTNIASFGGDPSRVIIDGVSAGGSAVALLLAANDGALGDKLFHGGIVESGGWVTMRDLEQGQKEYDCLTAEKACNGTDTSSIECLRNLPLADLYSSACWFNPNFDNNLFSGRLFDIFEAGKAANVPTIMGACANDATLYSFPDTANSTTDFDTYILGQAPTVSTAGLDLLHQLYVDQPAPVFPGKGNYYRQGANAMADLGTFCAMKILQNALVANNDAPTWTYKYAVRDAANEAAGTGAWHVVNNYAFYGVNTTDHNAPASYQAGAQAAVLQQTRAYWTSFVRNLDPNTDRAEGAPEWTNWTGPDGDARHRLIIASPASNVTDATGTSTRMEVMTEAQSLRCDAGRPVTVALGHGWPLNVTDPANVVELDAEAAQLALAATDCGFDEGCRAADCSIVEPSSGHFPEQVANAPFTCAAAVVASRSHSRAFLS